jgi:hypothetical protein
MSCPWLRSDISKPLARHPPLVLSLFFVKFVSALLCIILPNLQPSDQSHWCAKQVCKLYGLSYVDTSSYWKVPTMDMLISLRPLPDILKINSIMLGYRCPKCRIIISLRGDISYWRLFPLWPHSHIVGLARKSCDTIYLWKCFKLLAGSQEAERLSHPPSSNRACKW